MANVPENPGIQQIFKNALIYSNRYNIFLACIQHPFYFRND